MPETVAPTTAPLMNITRRPDLLFVRGQGDWLYDSDGRRYLDWVQGWAVNCLGHAPEVLVQALAGQAARLINPSPAFHNAPALALAQRLTRESVFDQVFFASSGAEANEGAIKLARKWGRLHRGGAHEIITFANGFHGRTLATMSASGKPGWDRMFAPQVPGFPKARYNDLPSVAALVEPATVAVLVEPIQGEAGVIPAAPGFLRELRKLCDRHGLLLIVDEVQTGCGRTGTLFAYQAAGIAPDIMTLGKGLGGGVPISALLARGQAACFEPGDQGGTYCGNPLVCAAALAVMEVICAPAFLAGCRALGELLTGELGRLSAEFGLGEVRGSGLLLALDTGAVDATRLAERARAHGLLLNAPRRGCLRLMPALNTTPEALRQGIDLLRQALRQMVSEGETVLEA